MQDLAVEIEVLKRRHEVTGMQVSTAIELITDINLTNNKMLTIIDALIDSVHTLENRCDRLTKRLDLLQPRH